MLYKNEDDLNQHGYNVI